LFGFFYFWKMNSNEIIVSEGKKPLWKTIIAAFLYTISLVLVYMFLRALYFDHETPKYIKGAFALLKLALFIFIGAVHLSLIKTIIINKEKEKLQTIFSVGMIKVKYFSEIPTLEYVSIFKNSQKEIFEVNLWYKGNKHYNVFNFEEFQPAFDFGLLYSNKLNIDLLDATEKGNSKWIDKTKL
jgi:hypothetical protein